MKSRDIALLILLGGAAYYLLRRNPATGRSLADDLLSGLPLPATGTTGAPGGYYAPAPSSNPNRAAQIAGLITSGAAVTVPLIAGGTTAAAAGAGGGAAAGAGAGIGLAGAAAAAGIAAGAAILAWGIISKGWFRGGEEALKVSPARNAYVQEFNARYGYPPSSDYEQQFAGFVRAGAEAGMPGYEVDRMRRRINKADTVAEWQAAADDATQTFKAYANLAGAAVLPLWRQQQLQGAVVFANGQTVDQLVASTRALGSGYADLVADYARGF